MYGVLKDGVQKDGVYGVKGRCIRSKRTVYKKMVYKRTVYKRTVYKRANKVHFQGKLWGFRQKFPVCNINLELKVRTQVESSVRKRVGAPTLCAFIYGRYYHVTCDSELGN